MGRLGISGLCDYPLLDPSGDTIGSAYGCFKKRAESKD